MEGLLKTNAHQQMSTPAPVLKYRIFRLNRSVVSPGRGRVMSGNVMGLIGVTELAVTGTAVVAIDRLGKRRKNQNQSSMHHRKG